VARNVLLLGLKGVVVDDVKDQVHVADIQLFGGTGIDDVRTTFERTSIDSVIMGGGIDLETRLEIVREIFQLSNTTSVPVGAAEAGARGSTVNHGRTVTPGDWPGGCDPRWPARPTGRGCREP
jgi:hypothetical protein